MCYIRYSRDISLFFLFFSVSFLFGCHGGNKTEEPQAIATEKSSVVFATVNTTSGTTSTSFSFDAKATFFDQEGNVLTTPESTSYEWIISDGRKLSGKAVSVTFDKDGLYIVEVQATNQDGVNATNDIAVTVFSDNSLGPSQLNLPDRYSDVNSDGVVNALDFLIIAQDVGGIEEIQDEKSQLRADLDLNGDVSGRDLELIGKAILNDSDLPSTVFSETKLQPFAKATLLSPSLLEPEDINLKIDGFNVDVMSRNILGYAEFIIPEEIVGGRTVELTVVSNDSEVDKVSINLEDAAVLPSNPIAVLEEYRNLMEELLPVVVSNYNEMYGDKQIANLYEQTQSANIEAFTDIINTLAAEQNSGNARTVASFMAANGMNEGLETLRRLKQQVSVTDRGTFKISSSLDICDVVDQVCQLRQFNEDYGDAVSSVDDACLIGTIIATALSGPGGAIVAGSCIVIQSASLANDVVNDLVKDINFELLFDVTEKEPGQIFNLLPMIEVKDGTGICRVGANQALALADKYVADKIADVIERIIKKKLRLDKIKKLLELLGVDDIQALEDYIEEAIELNLPMEEIAEEVVNLVKPICDSIGLRDGKLVGTTTDPIKLLEVDLSKNGLSALTDGSADFTCSQPGEVTATATKELCNRTAFRSETLTCGGKDVTVTFGDNGSLLDDIFSVEIGGKSISSNAPVRSKSETVTLPSGSEQNVLMHGLAAPDGIGTYYISFSGATVVSGQISGTDLTQGATKTFTIQVD